MPQNSRNHLILALDGSDKEGLKHLVAKMTGLVFFYKVGCWGYTAWGPELVEYIRGLGGEVFLDLKFHDIPHTVAGAVAEAARLGVYFLTLHAQGGKQMMTESVKRLNEVCQKEGLRKPKLLAITILTSLGETALHEELNVSADLTQQVIHLAKMAKDSGLDGVVASPQEVAILRQELGRDFLIVTPGVRPAQLVQDDQKRVLTPREAMLQGADYLVIGRPITQAPQPVEAVREILRQMATVVY
ncbi:MAG: orotidine-5'-phosphate decarboxylase [Candidatus Schekmanbacteria bacterium]|nr:orotidine-5'-phosphate decarboxylase [Candidatus Schekmanbacteria bacterium]